MGNDPEVVKLVQTTLRTFYEPRYIILMDQLVRKEAMRDEELAARVGLTTKDVLKISNKLAEDGFLATHRRPELRPGAMKATARTWYYIDYQRTIDNIKWRMYRIRKVIEDKLRNEIDSQGYVCPRCKKSFSTLDAGNLLDYMTNSMRCDVCGTEIIDNENVDEVKRSKDQIARLLGQTRPIVDSLKKTESISLTKFDIAAYLEKHHPVPQQGELPIPSTSGPAKVTIELVDSAEDSEAKKRKAAEADAKRTQNALPSWIERSTITGELTAVGKAQAASAKSGSSSGVTHQRQHSGSGMTAQQQQQHGAAVAAADGSISGEAGSSATSPNKTGTGENAALDDVDAYYAALAAAQAAYANANASKSSDDPGSGNAPSRTGENGDGKIVVVKREDQHYDDAGSSSTQQGSPSSGGHSKLVDSGYEEFGDEAFSTTAISPASPPSTARSPAAAAAAFGSTTSLTNGSLPSSVPKLLSNLRPPSSASMTHSLGKRSREPSEESESESGKKAKTEVNNTPVEKLSPAAAAAEEEEAEKRGGEANGFDAFEEVNGLGEEDEEDTVADDSVLTVAGKEIPYSKITEEMTADMTPDEYQLWWETMAVIG